MVTRSQDVEEIYDQMAKIRRERHKNVRKSVAGAEAVIDWGRYTWTYPWIGLGAAAAVGYLVYTSGHQKMTTGTAGLANGNKAGEPVAGAGTGGQERPGIGRNLLLTAWDLLFPVAMRAGQNYLLHCVEQQYLTRTVDRTGPSPLAGQRRSCISGVERQDSESEHRLQSKSNFLGGHDNE